jgi:hypothetical protein
LSTTDLEGEGSILTFLFFFFFLDLDEEAEEEEGGFEFAGKDLVGGSSVWDNWEEGLVVKGLGGSSGEDWGMGEVAVD